jgi:predicted regulator of Ras-like GTPase activity (Roadblock/LC7/MglB family)
LSDELSAVKAELQALTQQMVGLEEHRSRLMVLLTERSREIADLTTELVRIKTEGLRHLEDAQSATRQLRRANEKLTELTAAKLALETEKDQLHDETAKLRWELTSTAQAAKTAEAGLETASMELTKSRQELDAARRTIEAKNGAWEQERDQLKMTVSGLSIEIQNEHQAARVLERRWVLAGPESTAKLLGKDSERTPSQDALPVDYRVARTDALEEELESLRDERGKLSARLRELEREAGAAVELEKVQQELRNLQVERQLLVRKLEDTEQREEEREALRHKLQELQQQLRETDGLRAEVDRLRAKLYKTPLTSGTFAVSPRLENLGQEPPSPGDLESELAEFAQHFDVHSAVVADGLGFPVAATGSNTDTDNLAAVAGEADRLCTQACQILGLSEVTQLTLEDRHGTIAHFRYFPVEDSIMSVVTLGTQVPLQEDLDRLVGLTRHTLTEPRGRGVLAPYHGSARASATHPRLSAAQAVLAPVPEFKLESRVR